MEANAAKGQLLVGLTFWKRVVTCRYRPCRAWLADPALVAEDRSAEGVRDEQKATTCLSTRLLTTCVAFVCS
jgi:hypothetical protein